MKLNDIKAYNDTTVVHKSSKIVIDRIGKKYTINIEVVRPPQDWYKDITENEINLLSILDITNTFVSKKGIIFQFDTDETDIKVLKKISAQIKQQLYLYRDIYEKNKRLVLKSRLREIDKIRNLANKYYMTLNGVSIIIKNARKT